MTTTVASAPTGQSSLRLLPAVLLGALQLALWFALPALLPDQGLYWFLGSCLCGLLVLAWWAFFCAVPRKERWGTLALLVLALAATSRVLHPSIAGAGMGLLFYLLALPLSAFALVLALAVSGRRSAAWRVRAVLGALALSAAGWLLVRTDGVRGSGGLDLEWRWSPTAEERLLAAEASASPSRAGELVLDARSSAEWPEFRGAQRAGVVRGTKIATDWSSAPPRELWRRAVGPAWSSFAVQGDGLFTQEQRGDEELITCYRASTGEPIWRHRDATRFWEANAGAGPRATPTLHAGRLYAFGATGRLNALDARSGALLWSRDVAAEAEVQVPYWGFAGSPLVVADQIIVAASGRLFAYDLTTGEPRWKGAPQRGGYASPQLCELGGVSQVVLLNGNGAIGLAPRDGAELWQHAWEGVGVLQPALLAGGDLLISSAGPAGGAGVRRIAVTRDDNAWSTAERWTSRGLKPYYSDLVVHGDHAYGFDGSILSCIELTGGQRRWKDGRYGNGQLLLLAEQALLLVLSEDGELVLVRAEPERHVELARHAALEGKTWNHPVLVGDLLFVRNDAQMAAFRLQAAP
jgi:outer membrane protein assembly factor BamB